MRATLGAEPAPLPGRSELILLACLVTVLKDPRSRAVRLRGLATVVPLRWGEPKTTGDEPARSQKGASDDLRLYLR